MSSSPKDETTWRYAIKFSKQIADVEKRFNYMCGHINSLEEAMDEGDSKSNAIKMLVTAVLKEFGSNEKYRGDSRMLVLWKLMGKYSVNMGMNGVFENVHRLGFFKSNPEFYLMWAEHLGSVNDRDKFDKLVQICEKNCHLSSFESHDLFKPMLQKYFDANDSTGKTLDLIKMLAYQPEVVRQDLTLFQRQKKDDGPVPAESVAADNFSFAQHQQHSLALNQQQQQQSIPPQTTGTNREEFSIFKDPTATLPTQPIQNTATSAPVLLTSSAVVTVSSKVVSTKKENPPPPARSRRSSYFPELNDVTVAGSHGKFSDAMLTSTPRRSMAPGAFEPTLEEFSPQHREQYFEEFVTSFMQEGRGNNAGEKNPATEKGGGLFGLATSTCREVAAGGGTKLQKRLSFADEQSHQQVRVERPKTSNPMAEAVERVKKAAKNTPNELVRTLPQLNIDSTIKEETEEKENNESGSMEF